MAVKKLNFYLLKPYKAFGDAVVIHSETGKIYTAMGRPLLFGYEYFVAEGEQDELIRVFDSNGNLVHMFKFTKNGIDRIGP